MNPTLVSRSFAVVAASPVNLLVVDPEGLRTGYDPSSGTIRNEIPSSGYYGPDSEPEAILISEPMEGAYSVVLTGTSNGSYTLGVILSLPEEFFVQTYVGDIVSKDVLVSVVTVSSSGMNSVEPAPPVRVSETLFVDGFDSTANGWSRTGRCPFLDGSSDYSYLYTLYKDKVSSWFSFRDGSVTLGLLDGTTLKVQVKEERGPLKGTIQFYLRANGVGETLVGEVDPTGARWKWYSFDVSSLLDTFEKIESAQLKVVSKADGKAYLYVNAAYLNTTCYTDSLAENLCVEGFSRAKRGWQESGFTPFLGSSSDNSYLYTKYWGKVSSWFSLRNSRAPWGKVTGATLNVQGKEARGPSTGTIQFYLRANGVGETLVGEVDPTGEGWEWRSFDVSSLLDTLAKINSAELKMVSKADGKAYLYVNAVSLDTTISSN
jgi:hypothetical protein